MSPSSVTFPNTLCELSDAWCQIAPVPSGPAPRTYRWVAESGVATWLPGVYPSNAAVPALCHVLWILKRAPSATWISPGVPNAPVVPTPGSPVRTPASTQIAPVNVR